VNPDQDKDNDLVTGNRTGNSVSLLINSAGTLTNVLTAPVGAQPESITTGDFDADGFVDIVTANRGDGTVSFLRGTGTTSFAPTVNFPAGNDTRSVISVDADMDGDEDLFVAVIIDGDPVASVLPLRNDVDLNTPDEDRRIIFAQEDPVTASSSVQVLLSGLLDADGRPEVIALNETSGGRDSTSVVVRRNISRPPCPADFNADGFVDFFDFDEFVLAYEAGRADADFNGDGFIDFFDVDDFVLAFENGC
jgi:hypothetical protein